jgi:hypothetical protein
MSSWPAFFGAALAIWLLLKGPAAEDSIWVQKACRAAMAFFLYSGFLYLLKWTPFWKVMPATGLREPKQAGRFSDPDIDAHSGSLRHCESCFGVPALRCPFRANLRITPRDRKDFAPFTLTDWLFSFTIFSTRK